MQPESPTPTILDRFDALILAYVAEAGTAPTEDAVERALRFRRHLVGVLDHWVACDASPVRAAKKAAGV